MDNVTIQRNAFVFCRYSVALLIWLALILQDIYVLVAAFVILALSAALKVHRAPLVWLYTQTLGRVIASKEVVLDVSAMRFAHTAGAVLALTCIILVYRDIPGAWIVVAGFAALKTLSAVGLCPAYKLYGCMMEGGCCALTGKK